MKKNVGNIDRILRYVAALVLVGVGLFALKGLEGNTTGIIVTAIAIIPVFTATFRFCPLYFPLGLSTKKDSQ